MLPFPIVNVIVSLVLVGLILWVVQQIPMDPVIARIIRVVVVVCVVLWLLSVFFGAPVPMAGPWLRR